MQAQDMQGVRAGPAAATVRVRRTAGWAAVACGLLALQALVVHGAAPAPAPAQQPAASGPTRAASTRVAQAGSRRTAADKRSGWDELSTEQQQALRPLAGAWPTLSAAQKRKWIALSRNYRRMSPDDQARLRSRMNDWVALSPQQRTQARLNFGETSDLSPDDKKAKWEAYQALSAEEKRKLAAGARVRTPRTAAAVKPVPAQKLARVPRGSRKAEPARTPDGPAAPPLPEPATAPVSADE